MAEETRSWQDIISSELSTVEEIMHEATRESDPEVQEVMDYALDSHGKMIRPSMLILACRACGKESTRTVLQYAAAAELVHMATLIQDDINDESDSRRGKTATHKKYGVRKALSISDMMLVKAISLFDYNTDVMKSITAMGSSLADSEFLQYNHKFDLDIMEQEYYQVIDGKTAAFLSQCAKIGAISAEQPEETVEELARFGQLYGMAFQIADDLIDLIGSEKVSGKTAMRDLSEGIITLPTILAIRDVKVGNKIRGMIKKGASLDDVRELIMQTEAIDDCKLIIQDYVEEAIDALSILPDSEYKQSLIDLTRLNLTRLS